MVPGAEMGLQFGEGHFDQIDVGAVGRQKDEPSGPARGMACWCLPFCQGA